MLRKMYSKLRFNSPSLYFIIGLMVSLGTAMTLSSFAATGNVSGVAFKDLNRNQVMDPGEEPLAGIEIYLFDSTGRPILHAPTDATGRYQLLGAPAGVYTVHYDSSAWWNIWNDWVPTTTNGSLQPDINIQLTDANPSATANFGWRPITRSTDVNAPITTMTAPNGLVVSSYDDVVSAQEVYNTIMQSTLHGDETKYTNVRFDFGQSNITRASFVKDPVKGYIDYQATVYLTYVSWVTSGDTSLIHEYGHAWSIYYNSIVQQDSTNFTGYIKARGLTGDSRLGTNSAWDVKEMIAEDYRQLFGTPNAVLRPQANSEIPIPSQVPGLKEYLMGDFMNKPATPPPSDTSSPSAPTNLTGTLSTGKISLAWSASTDNVGVTNYDVYRNNTLIASTSTTSYTDSNLGAASSFSYYVKARDASGNASGASNTVIVTIPLTLTGTVTNSSGTALSGVKVSTGGKGATGKSATTNSSGTYTLTGLSPGTYSLTYSLKGYTSTTLSVTLTGGIFTQNVTLQKR